MSIELATLEQKLDTATALMNAKLELILSRVDELSRSGKPGMTQRAFAKLMNVSPRTVSRWVGAKKLRLERGMVPHSEVRKFLS